MPAPDLTAIAAAAKATVDNAHITLFGQAVKAYDTEPAGLDSLPAVAVRLDSFQRRAIDDGEVEIGSAMWDLLFQVTVYTPLDEAHAGQRGMLQVAAQVIDAFDGDPSLGGVVDDAVLTSGEQSFTDDADQPRQMVVLTCDLLVRARST